MGALVQATSVSEQSAFVAAPLNTLEQPPDADLNLIGLFRAQLANSFNSIECPITI